MIASREIHTLSQCAQVALSKLEQAQREQQSPDIEIPSLYDFAREAWDVLEPGTPFVEGEHLQAICLHLEAVTEGRIKRLLINMPPRHAKSTIISVIWPVWTWLKKPSHRFLCASYALALAIRDNAAARRLIESHWFQSRYGAIFSLAKDQNEKKKFQTSKGGYRQAVSVGSGATGEGADTLLIDDLHGIQEKTSTTKRQGALDWFRNTWYSRLNNKRTGAMVVVGQRIHFEDVSGYILKGETGDKWVHLNLPAEFDPDNRCVTNAEGFHWEDWRELKGDLLWPQHFPQEVIDKAKKTHGAIDYAAIYGQQPVPASGGKFKREWLRFFTETADAYVLERPGGPKTVYKGYCEQFITVDPAISLKQIADYTVFGIWAVTPERDLLLTDLIRTRMENPDQIKQMKVLRLQYRTHFKVESVAYQSALIQQALLEGIPCTPYYPGSLDKVSRSATAAIWMENGKTFLSKHAIWLQDVIDELLTFPMGEHDDIVDNFTMSADEVSLSGGMDEEAEKAYTNYRGY